MERRTTACLLAGACTPAVTAVLVPRMNCERSQAGIAPATIAVCMHSRKDLRAALACLGSMPLDRAAATDHTDDTCGEPCETWKDLGMGNGTMLRCHNELRTKSARQNCDQHQSDQWLGCVRFPRPSHPSHQPLEYWRARRCTIQCTPRWQSREPRIRMMTPPPLP